MPREEVRIVRNYRKRPVLARDLGVSIRLMEDATEGLQKHSGRYPVGVIRSDKIVLLDREMVLDWIRFREALDAGVRVPAFNRADYQ